MATEPLDPLEIKREHRRFYDEVSNQLNRSEFGDYSHFLNLGYAATGDEWSAVELPKRLLNRHSTQLALELIGDCVVTDLRVLDIGCGRGGTVRTVATYFRPRLCVGLDLSRAAVSFGRRTHRLPKLRFCQGDAEQLPFPARAFDVVTNLESSHCYPRIEMFYAEVHRVLTDGGYFLYGDILPVPEMTGRMGLLESAGFTTCRRRDITANVLTACDEIAGQRAPLFENLGAALRDDFLAVPGSRVYEWLKSGEYGFTLLKLEKSSPTRAR